MMYLNKENENERSKMTTEDHKKLPPNFIRNRGKRTFHNVRDRDRQRDSRYINI